MISIIGFSGVFVFCELLRWFVYISSSGKEITIVWFSFLG